MLGVPRALPVLSPPMAARAAELEAGEAAAVQARFDALIGLHRSSMSLRAHIARHAAAATASFEAEKVVHKADMERLLDGAHWVIELDIVLYQIWLTYRAALPEASEPDPFAPASGANLLSAKTRLRTGLVALAADLMRMDNARFAIDAADASVGAVHLLNRGLPARGIPAESYDRLLGMLTDPDHRRLLAGHLAALDGQREALLRATRGDPQLAFLLALIDESPEGARLRAEAPLARYATYSSMVLTRSVYGLAAPLMDLWFKAALDEVIATGRAQQPLRNLPAVVLSLSDTIEPLDVLVWRAPDAAAVGDGVAGLAIVAPTRRALVAQGKAAHPGAVAYADALRQRERLVVLEEAGASVVSLDELLTARDVVVLRPASADQPAQLERLLGVLAAGATWSDARGSSTARGKRLWDHVAPVSQRDAGLVQGITRRVGRGYTPVWGTVQGVPTAPAEALDAILQKSGPGA